jgi:hypothetical protein
MAGTTIHSLAYIVTANTEDFEKGMIATRQELRASKKLMQESVPAIDQYRMALSNADNMLRKGLIDKKTHTATVSRLKNEYGQMSASAKLMAEGSERFGRALRGYAAAAVGVGAVHKAINAIKGEFLNIDATLKDANKLGIAIEDLMKLRGVANIAGDATAEQVDKAIAKLNMNLKHLHEGADSAIAMFEQIGLTAEDLQGLDLGDAFLKVADGIKNIQGAEKQLAITQEILGKGAGDLANMMKMGANEIERMGQAIPAVNTLDAEKIAKAKDAMEKIERSMTGIAQVLAVQLAPAIEAAAQSIDFYFGRPKRDTRGAISRGSAGPQNMVGTEYLQGQFRRSNTNVDNEQFVSFMNLAARVDPNFTFSAAGNQSETFNDLTRQMYAGTQRFEAGTIGRSQYEQEIKQLFQAMFMELMRMREATEQANEIAQSEGAKVE